MAVKNCSVPLAMVGATGVTLIDTSDAAETVRVAEPVIAPKAAVIVVAPTLRPVATPVAVIDAMLVTEEAQVTDAETSSFVPLLYVAMAVNCRVSPRGRLEFAGSTLIEVTVAVVPVPVVPVVLVSKVLDEAPQPESRTANKSMNHAVAQRRNGRGVPVSVTSEDARASECEPQDVTIMYLKPAERLFVTA